MTTTINESFPPSPAPSPTDASVLVSCYMPRRRRWEDHRRRPDGSIETITHIFTLTGNWETMPESRDPAWATEQLGPFTLACRIID